MQFRLLGRSFLLFLCAVCLAQAQTITGSIVGSVVDASGSAVPGTTITVRNQDTGITVEAVVDQSGTYSVPNLFAGRYAIETKKEGFQSVALKDIQLLASQTVREDFTLQVGQVTTAVAVTALAPLIHTDSHTIGSSLGSAQLSNLPLATRSIDGLIALAPGVSTSGNNPRISGSNYWGGNNYSLNGVSVNDVGNGGAAYTSGAGNLGLANMPAPDSLQEFKIDSGNQNAEYRDVATITMVTKQGGNSFHGLAYEYLENKALNANQFLLNATRQPKPDYKLNQFGADLGGAFIKNKVFFYGAYRGVRQRSAKTVNLTLPSLAMRNGDFSALCTTFAAGICTDRDAVIQSVHRQPVPQQSDSFEPDHLAGENAAAIPAHADQSEFRGAAEWLAELHHRVLRPVRDQRRRLPDGRAALDEGFGLWSIPLVEGFAVVSGVGQLSFELRKQPRLRLHRFRHQRNRDAHFQPDGHQRIARGVGSPRQRPDRPEHRFQALVPVPAASRQR